MRLVTRADFDGIVCGALITKIERIDSFLFVEPKFVQDGQVAIRRGDIIANLPYHPDCTLWFDHHITNSPAWVPDAARSNPDGAAPRDPRPETRESVIVPGKGAFRLAPSAARVVYEYYTETGDPTDPRSAAHIAYLNTERMHYLLNETDRIDAGKLEQEDVLNPRGYVLISMTTDGKNAGDEPYWLRVIELLREASLEDTLKDSEVRRRCRQILDDQEKLKKILLERTTLKGNVIYVDLRGLKEIPDGNRFLLYTLFPTGNISVKIAEDNQTPGRTAISVGYNIFNTTSKVNVGELLSKHGGGGHRVVGSCRVPNDRAEQSIREILEAVKE